ncbi:hypothetical protein [Gemelliphila palaticanis]|uniref:Uncharacterized protein n=1 Tax=Gemelliphila palaticanis TaxID=81950 RepID=A0ABX2SZN2_9BACL|nr:hypothetical protein [Gemella palaticanis]MBF0714659.1 hypothetical protein [Gemella palaticanis]NYS46589.1 hypothetical protein [Gemella palaticanis]
MDRIELQKEQLEQLEIQADRLTDNIIILDTLKDYCSLLNFGDPTAVTQDKIFAELLYKVRSGYQFQDNFLNVVSSIIKNLQDIREDIEKVTAK